MQKAEEDGYCRAAAKYIVKAALEKAILQVTLSATVKQPYYLTFLRRKCPSVDLETAYMSEQHLQAGLWSCFAQTC